jgi:hypothetical protein
MKTGKWMKCIVALMLMCIGVLPVMAQKNIDKVVKELEGRSDVSINSVTKRDPKTRKVISMTKIYSVRDTRMAGALRRAFEKDEEFAVTAHMNMPKGRANAEDMNLYFVFYPVDNEKHSYTLTCNKNGEMTLTIIVKQVKGNRDVSDLDFDSFFNNVEMKTKILSAKQKVKDELGCFISENGRGTVYDNGDVVMEGDVTYNGKKLKKGVHWIDGRKVTVK